MNTAVAEDTVDTISGGVKKAPDRPMSYYEQKRVRTGKTRRDHESGAWKRRLDNNSQRAGWRNASKQGHAPFPTHICKGLGNSSKRYKVQAGKIVG